MGVSSITVTGISSGGSISITVTGISSGGSIAETGIMGSEVGRGAMLGNIVTIDSWGSYGGSYWGSVGSNMGQRLGNMVGNSLSFVQRLVVGGLGLNNRFLGKDGLVFNNGVGDMVDGSNGTRDHSGNGSGLMDKSGLGNGVPM